MLEQEFELLLIKISQIMSGKEKAPFSLHELAHTVHDNQCFYHVIRASNIQRMAYYRRAQFLSGAMTIITLGLYLLFYERPRPPTFLTVKSAELSRKPDTLLPAEVAELTIGHGTKVLGTLIEKGILVATGEYPGTVYHPTEKLWEVSV